MNTKATFEWAVEMDPDLDDPTTPNVHSLHGFRLNKDTIPCPPPVWDETEDEQNLVVGDTT